MRAEPLASPRVTPARHLQNVRYEIRGPLARRAEELERAGHEVIKLNIGNPAAFGFQAPESMRRAVLENLHHADGYCHQKGVPAAREAVAEHARAKGIAGVSADDVLMGNGVSELILMTMEALLEPGDEVLLPAPDYPLWSAAVAITGARPVYYACRPENGFLPDPEQIARQIGPRTRALVMINPNNPSGAVYPPDLVAALAGLAERHRLVLFSDEIYDRIVYDGARHVPAATVCRDTLCVTFGGLSKVHRACGLRTGWIHLSGRKEIARDYIQTLELLASLRLCASVPGQWAVQAALEGRQCIDDLTAPGGRLHRQRAAVIRGVEGSRHLTLRPPQGALYAFVGVRPEAVRGFDDARFAMELLEKQHVLVVPGSSFNVDYGDHFRVTLLPDEEILSTVFSRIDALLDDWAE